MAIVNAIFAFWALGIEAIPWSSWRGTLFAKKRNARKRKKSPNDAVRNNTAIAKLHPVNAPFRIDRSLKVRRKKKTERRTQKDDGMSFHILAL
jgi:hypothetical protein